MFRAAAEAGVRRFVYASSVAAYGFHSDNPIGMTEEWPMRPASRLFYAQEKAELEQLLKRRRSGIPSRAVPAAAADRRRAARRRCQGARAGRLGRGARCSWTPSVIGRCPSPVPAPTFPLQFIHEDDVGQALLLCTVAAGPAGAYNVAGDGVVTLADVAREAGFTPLPVPAGLVRAAPRLASAVPTLPFVPPAVEWVEALAHPAIMDAGKAKRDLGWTPRYTSLEALRAALADR